MAQWPVLPTGSLPRSFSEADGLNKQQIRDLQYALRLQGLNSVPLTGVYDRATARALLGWQVAHATQVPIDIALKGVLGTPVASCQTYNQLHLGCDSVVAVAGVTPQAGQLEAALTAVGGGIQCADYDSNAPVVHAPPESQTSPLDRLPAWKVFVVAGVIIGGGLWLVDDYAHR